MITPRWVLHTIGNRHLPDCLFTPERYWFRSSALRAGRRLKASVGGQLFHYELEDARTGERTPL